MMIEISFEINGRKVQPRSMADALERAVLEGVKDKVTKAVGSVRCAEHGKSPSIKVKGKSVQKLSFQISGCCDTLIDKVKAKLK